MPTPSSDSDRCSLLDAISRRRLIAGGAALLLAAPMRTGAQTPVASPIAGTWPRTITDARGESVTISAPPTSIYTLRNSVEFDTVVALGAVPAAWGTFPDRTLQPYQLAAGGVDNGIDVTDGPNLEEMLARGIDIIFAADDVFDVVPEEIATLRQLSVPVVAIPGRDVHGQLRIVGEALGLEDVAAERAAEFDANLQAFQPDVMPTSLSLLLAFETTQLYLLTSISAAGETVENLGLPPLSTPDDASGGERTDLSILSLERANEIDAEWLIVLIYDEAVYTELSETPVFQAIPAVRAGRVRTLEGDQAWAITGPDVLTLPITIDALTVAFANG